MLAKVYTCAVVGLDGQLVERITVNLALAELKKEGASYDLPIAVGLLIASEQLDANPGRVLFLGELSLDGSLRHTDGTLCMVLFARRTY